MLWTLTRRALTLIAILLVGSTSLEAATYYVAAANGNDSRSCTTAQTQATPKLTLNSAVACLAPGDTLLVRTGTYNERLLYNIPSGTSWSNKVRVAAFPSETVWLAPTSATGNVVEFGGLPSGLNQQYIELDGINIDAAGATGGSLKINGSASNDNAHHIRVQNAELSGNASGGGFGGSMGILASGSMGPSVVGFNEFVNLSIHFIGYTPGDYHHGFYLNSGDNLIANCHIYDFSGHGIQLYSFYANTSSRNVVRNNVIEGSVHYPEGTRAIVFRGDQNQFYNNVIIGFDSGSGSPGVVSIIGTGNLLYNNTVYNTTNGIGFFVYTADAINTVLINNISYNPGGGGVGYQDNGVGTTQANNLFSSVTNPQFLNTSTFDFHLQAGSPARDTGQTVAAVTVDYAGVPRPQNGTYDIGAYEYTATGGPTITAATGTTVVDATFAGTFGTNLTTGTWGNGGIFTEHPAFGGDILISPANRARVSQAATLSLDYASGTPITAEYDVGASVTVLSNVGDVYQLWGHLDTTVMTGYLAFYHVPSASFFLYEYVDGGSTQLASYPVALTVAQTYSWRFKIRLTSVSFDLDGAQVMYASTTRLPLKGKAGFGGYSATTPATGTGLQYNSFSVRDVASASSPTIGTSTLLHAALTRTYADTLVASGGTAPYSWTVVTGPLPTGITLNATSGVLSGIPTTAADYPLTIRVTDNVGGTSTKDLALLVRAQAAVSTASPVPDATLESLYSLALTGTGDDLPYVWALTAGTLPTGLTLTSGGTITGLPTVAATSTFVTVRITGALGSTSTKSLAITVGGEYRPAGRPVARNQDEGVVFRRSTAPTNPVDRAMKGDLWIDISVSPPVLKVCTGASATAATWATVP